jgi:MoaA/NifB/PqqE/SkfB family radical SAM enzyme
MASVLRFAGACNNRCVVCTGTRGAGTVVRSAGDVTALGEKTPQAGPTEGATPGAGEHRYVLRGREPSVQRDFFAILETLQARGGRMDRMCVRTRSSPNVTLHTNGRLFSYRGAAARTRALGVDRVVISLHGAAAAVHQRHTGAPQSFAQSLAGVRRFVEAGVSVVLRCVVTQINYRTLDRWVALARAEGCRGVRLVYPGRVETAPVDLAYAGPYLAAAVLQAQTADLKAVLCGVCPCALIGIEAQWCSVLAQSTGKDCDGEHGGVRIQAPACRRCAFAKQCEGVGPGQPVWPVDRTLLPLSCPSAGSASAGRRCFDIVVRTECANRCLFCTTRIIHQEAQRAWSVDRPSAVLGKLEERLRNETAPIQVRMVAIEPLEHPAVLLLIAAAARWSQHGVWVASSARRLAKRGFAKRLVRAGLGALEVPLFGPSAAIHDRVAGRRGAFAETVQGIKNLEKAGFREVGIHTVWLKPNAEQLFETAQLAERLTGRPLTNVTLAAPACWRLAPYKEVAFDFDAVLAALAAQSHRFGFQTVSHCLKLLSPKVPFCLLHRYFPHIFTRRAALSGRARQSDRPQRLQPVEFTARPERGALLKRRRHCPWADACVAAPICAGIYPEYLGLFSCRPLTPFRPDSKRRG